MTKAQQNARETILTAQTEREYKIALEHISVAKKRDKGEVFIKLPDSVGDRVRKKLEDDRYSVVSMVNGLTHVVWVGLKSELTPEELRRHAASKLTQAERDVLRLNKDGTYRFAIAVHKVEHIIRDSWSGSEEGKVEWFDTETEARQYVKEYNEKHCPPLRPGQQTPERYQQARYAGITQSKAFGNTDK